MFSIFNDWPFVTSTPLVHPRIASTPLVHPRIAVNEIIVLLPEIHVEIIILLYCNHNEISIYMLVFIC